LPFTQARRSLGFALTLGVMLLASTIVQRVYVPALAAQRTFFGTHRVASESGGRFHSLSHGTTLHGLESTDPSMRNEPLTYYHRRGPLGQAFARIPRLRAGVEMAVVGLGTGSTAAYAGESQRWTFFEIDPVVEHIARDTRYFHFLETCGARCAVVLGDARLSLCRPW
jgi:hypothetical protein